MIKINDKINLPKTNNKTKNPHISSLLGFSKYCEYTFLKFDEQKALYMALSF
jgi:hypothetical protein